MRDAALGPPFPQSLRRSVDMTGDRTCENSLAKEIQCN